MHALPLLSLLLAVAGWLLLGSTGMNILSGPFDERTCLTDCVRTLFFAGTAAGVGGLVLGLFGLRKPESRLLGYVALAFVLPLLGIIATLFVIGNFGWHVSLENNGSFLQLSLDLSQEGLLDASAYVGVRLNVRGNDER